MKTNEMDKAAVSRKQMSTGSVLVPYGLSVRIFFAKGRLILSGLVSTRMFSELSFAQLCKFPLSGQFSRRTSRTDLGRKRRNWSKCLSRPCDDVTKCNEVVLPDPGVLG